ncbi:hypothetical protein LCGC14_2694050, partial [marine sediment metagenome]
VQEYARMGIEVARYTGRDHYHSGLLRMFKDLSTLHPAASRTGLSTEVHYEP